MQTEKPEATARRPSAAGKFFRRLADFFDSGGTSAFAGTKREVDIVTLTFVFVGLVVAGTWIHGWNFFAWNFLFATFFCAAVWCIFASSRWSLKARALLIISILLFSIGAASERILALAMFILLSSLMLRSYRGDFLRRETISVVAVALFCFSSYDAFAGVLEWRRSAMLEIQNSLPLECGKGLNRVDCRSGDVAFAVPEFWSTGKGSNLIKDLAAIANFKIYADGGTDNSIAFATFSEPGAKIIQQIATFLNIQKGFLRSHSLNKDPLTLVQIMKSADTALYTLHYESGTAPGYLAESREYVAMILLHERRGVTWLFVIDGAEFATRDFLLHRVISGFR